VEAYLHDIHDETTTVNLHVFGEPPPKPLLVPWLVTCLGQDFLDRLGEVLKPPPQVARMPSGRRLWLRQEGEKVLDRVVFHGFSAIDALRAEGAVFAAEELPKRLRGCFDRAAKLQDGFAKTPREIDGLMAALNGRFIPPGPGNSPDRNPAVLPTGRNMYVMNPEEVPSRPSWEIGKQLIEQLLAQQMKSKGRHPQKVAFTLDSFATFQDYGVMESQILYLLGVRPVWDERNCVTDVELIPAAELGRPRIDVFISAGGYYRDILPTRMRLLDKAIRLVAARDEPGNNVYGDSVRVAEELRRTGADPQRAAAMSQGRMFGPPPGQIGGGSYYYLVERSGQWNGQKDLMDAYLSFSRYIYTGDLWGVEAPRAYDRQIQGSEVLLRSWSDRTRSALSNKYDWYLGGSLSLAIKQLTGREPEWFISDVRDADRTSLLVAEDALSRDFHVRLLNRKWIEGMMKEGYAGADQIAVHVSNALGWSIMRQGSVSDDTWNELAAIYVQDKLGLSLRRWFDTENPYAFQDASEVMLEAARKGYWNAPPATLRLVAQQYAQSVVQHGEGGGLRGGGNAPLERFVVDALHSAKAAEADRLAVQYQGRLREAAVAVREVASGTAPGASLVAARLSPAPGSFVQPEGATGSLPARASPAPADKPPAAPAAAESKSNTAAPATIAAVRGNKLQPAAPPRAASEHLAYRRALIFGTVTGALLLIVAGFLFRRGAP
jgi:cobaltochelatase CobN